MTDHKKRKFVYATSCVDCGDGDKINAMKDIAVDVTYETMLKNCRGLLEWADQQGYERSTSQGSGVTLKRDPHVSFHKSRFNNLLCYYVCWSAIEFIWCLET